MMKVVPNDPQDMIEFVALSSTIKYSLVKNGDAPWFVALSHIPPPVLLATRHGDFAPIGPFLLVSPPSPIASMSLQDISLKPPSPSLLPTPPLALVAST
ncbi:hypothetical protein HanRHA438_Chr01g0018731 [Helianthus annuus]|nr:hypothetical protein HanRHA438_Chr01g0018731 [Helianthus annuus]